ncbi:hypothetical protein B0J14DRAFT_597988 [Halenospora varia]|nr:hypothetical protein B0J14DRAFT_597988 [Halenospora varia]
MVCHNPRMRRLSATNIQFLLLINALAPQRADLKSRMLKSPRICPILSSSIDHQNLMGRTPERINFIPANL